MATKGIFSSAAPGSYLLDSREALAQRLLAAGMDTSPIQHWTQGLARLAQALVGKQNLNAIDSEQNAANEAFTKGMSSKQWINPDFNQPIVRDQTSGEMVPTPQEGGIPGAISALQGVNNVYARDMAGKLQTAKASADYEQQQAFEQNRNKYGYDALIKAQEGQQNMEKQKLVGQQGQDLAMVKNRLDTNLKKMELAIQFGNKKAELELGNQIRQDQLVLENELDTNKELAVQGRKAVDAQNLAGLQYGLNSQLVDQRGQNTIQNTRVQGDETRKTADVNNAARLNQLKAKIALGTASAIEIEEAKQLGRVDLAGMNNASRQAIAGMNIGGRLDVAKLNNEGANYRTDATNSTRIDLANLNNNAAYQRASASDKARMDRMVTSIRMGEDVQSNLKRLQSTLDSGLIEKRGEVQGQLNSQNNAASMQRTQAQLASQERVAKQKGEGSFEMLKYRMEQTAASARELESLRAQNRVTEKGILDPLQKARLTKLEAENTLAAKSRENYAVSLDKLIRDGEALLKDPGRTGATGKDFFRSMIPGSKEKDFAQRFDSFMSKNFIPAVRQLVGLGSLSNAEGQRLLSATTSLDLQMSEPGFENDMKLLLGDIRAARERAGRGVTVDPNAPDALPGATGGAAAPAAPSEGSSLDDQIRALEEELARGASK